MNPHLRAVHPLYDLLPTDIDGFDSLAELALDLRSSWNHATDEVWRELDPKLWNITQNPWVVLQTASRDRIQRVLGDPGFRQNVDRLVKIRRQLNERPAWFQKNHPHSELTCVAYFSMEFMLSESLPIYSGGLGNVAGDQLKAASDLGIPVVGVGLLYQKGYFHQIIDKDGWQQTLYPYNDPGQLPITPLRHDNGEWLRLEVVLPGYSVWLRAWQAQVGRVRLYLLDSNDAANFPAHRGITSELYGGGPELRLKQELVLGIGGWRLLAEMGIDPEVCHLNEGHAAFAVLERTRSFMQATGLSFDAALAATRAGNLFTTHTAVAAGFDHFDPQLIRQYLGGYAQRGLGISIDELLALGRQHPDNDSENFNMAYLAIRGSGAVSGVSALHEQVSKHIFEPLFPHWPIQEVPVRHVTNGVHTPSWDSAAADELWTNACHKTRWLGTTESLESDIRCVSDEDLWQLRLTSSQELINFARDRLSRELAASGSSSDMVHEARQLFDPTILTLGFARRFATYKRPNLLLYDPQRLLRLLTNSERPVQLIIAGKAHPRDRAGQELIHQWINFIRQPAARPHVMFLGDYDMLLTGHLVQGVDVWINTPRRPWEASGTSGMKVLVNGGINLSELDGWWAEAYSPQVGWALGDGQDHGDDPAWDAIEANQLYELLEREVVSEFYDRNEQGIPTAWVARMRESMSLLTPRFSANRTVREYTEQHYLPAAATFRERSADGGAMGQQIVDWRIELEKKWTGMRFGKVKIETRNEQHYFDVALEINGCNPNAIRVELYADAGSGNPAVRLAMQLNGRLTDPSGIHVYTASVPATRAASDFTTRVIPQFHRVNVPLENRQILWQH